jgi:hypothetical protein
MSSPSESWQRFVRFGLLVPNFRARVLQTFFGVQKHVAHETFFRSRAKNLRTCQAPRWSCHELQSSDLWFRKFVHEFANFFLVCKNMSRTKHFPLACKKKLTFIVKPLGELARVFEVQTVGFEMFLHEFANFCTNIFRSRVTFAKLSKFQILTTIFTHVGGNLGRRTKKVYDHVEPLGVVNTGLKQIRFRISCTIANFFCRIRRA